MLNLFSHVKVVIHNNFTVFLYIVHYSCYTKIVKVSYTVGSEQNLVAFLINFRVFFKSKILSIF